MNSKILIIMLVVVLLLILVGTAQTDNGFEMPRWVLGGGASESTSSNATLNATLGQPFVGLVSSGDTSLEQGFWHGRDLHIYLPIVQK